MTLPQREKTSRDRDAALLHRCKAGDSEAYAELLRLYRDRAVNLAYGILRNAADAEDAAQEAFIRVFRKLPDFRGESAFFSWLYRIVVNESITMLHKSSRREVPYEAELHGGEDSRSKATEQRLDIDSVLGMMPVRLRTILVLREIDELSYDEIAGVLDVPIGTVRSRLSTARELFRRKYKEIMGDGM